jgi:hypothetical protein
MLVIARNEKRQLALLSMSTGATLAVLATMFNVQPYFVAVDPLSSDIFVHVFHASKNQVHRYAVSGADEAPQLVFVGGVDQAGNRPPTVWRPLTVVPPAPHRRTSHLVVGASKERDLLVLSLPDCALVHTHQLPPGFLLRGLAADQAGSALVVADERGSVHIIPWPLPGMPEPIAGGAKA